MLLVTCSDAIQKQIASARHHLMPLPDFRLPTYDLLVGKVPVDASTGWPEELADVHVKLFDPTEDYLTGLMPKAWLDDTLVNEFCRFLQKKGRHHCGRLYHPEFLDTSAEGECREK